MVTMMSNDFEHAARFEGELSERQREVLALIAAGRTNAEIADALEMTLAGAKWHVSEILTKLGLDSREEAAAYWHWRQAPPRRARRALGGLLGLFGWKAAAGAAAAAVAVAGVAGAALLAGTDDSKAEDGPGQPFYLEARTFETEPGGGTIHVLFEHRWWYRDPTHSYAETGSPGAPQPFARSVADGSSFWSQMRGEQYGHGDQPPVWASEHATSAFGGNVLGPIPFATMDELLTRMRPGAQGRVVGQATVEGRKVILIEWPTDVGITTGSATTWSTGTYRIEVDVARWFVMAAEGSSPIANGSRTEVTLLRYGQDSPDSRFVFVPEPGTVENVCKFRPVTHSPAAVVTPTGFFSVPAGVAPDGWVAAGVASPGVDGRCERIQLTLQPPGEPRTELGGRFIFIEETRPAAAAPGKAPGHLRPDGLMAGAGMTDFGQALVTWVGGDVQVTVRSNVLTVEELLAFTDQMARQP